ncbi:MAG: helix-turn-helix transcriptional regulator [Clostridia bacterium]|nr:helix-turn-helix transcriptional regulator [Clostridia bacterium]
MKKDFKDICKELLIELNLTQGEFAKKIGTKQCTVSKWLNGVQEPRFFQLQNIATTFNIDPNFLLGLD